MAPGEGVRGTAPSAASSCCPEIGHSDVERPVGGAVAANFYRHYGFELSPVDDLTLILLVKDVVT